MIPQTCKLNESSLFHITKILQLTRNTVILIDNCYCFPQHLFLPISTPARLLMFTNLDNAKEKKKIMEFMRFLIVSKINSGKRNEWVTTNKYLKII